MSENISAPGPIRPSLPHGPTQCTAVQKAFAEVLARTLAERWAAFSPQLSSSPNSLAAPSISDRSQPNGERSHRNSQEG